MFVSGEDKESAEGLNVISVCGFVHRQGGEDKERERDVWI